MHEFKLNTTVINPIKLDIISLNLFKFFEWNHKLWIFKSSRAILLWNSLWRNLMNTINHHWMVDLWFSSINRSVESVQFYENCYCFTILSSKVCIEQLLHSISKYFSTKKILFRSSNKKNILPPPHKWPEEKKINWNSYPNTDHHYNFAKR